MKNRRADFAAIMCALIWGLGYPMTFLVLREGITPFQSIAIRFTFSGLILLAVFYKRMKTVTFSTLKCGAFLGFLMFIAFILQTVALKYTTPAKNAFLTAAVVIIVPFINWIITKIKPDIYSFAGAFLSILGISILTLTGGSLLSINIGDILTLMGSLCLAIHMIFMERFLKYNDMVHLTVIQLITGGISGLCIAFMEGAQLSFTTAGVVSMAYLTIFSSLAGYLLQTYAQKFLSAAKTSIIISTEAVFGTVFSALMFGDAITARIVIGGFILMTAIVCVETKFDFLPRRKVAVDVPSDE